MVRRNKLIIGSAIGLASIASVLDHLKHGLPEPVEAQAPGYSDDASPCSMDSPCAMGESPCAMDDSPCALGESPCSL